MLGVALFILVAIGMGLLFYYHHKAHVEEQGRSVGVLRVALLTKDGDLTYAEASDIAVTTAAVARHARVRLATTTEARALKTPKTVQAGWVEGGLVGQEAFAAAQGMRYPAYVVITSPDASDIYDIAEAAALQVAWPATVVQ